MHDDSKVKGFPEISAKLSAAPKKSHFERQKAEAEAKRAREKAETAAVYEDFVKSFDHEGDGQSTTQSNNNPNSRPYHGNFGPGTPVGPAKRHFSGGTMKAVGMGNFGRPPVSFAKKRPYDALRESPRDGEKNRGVFAFENAPGLTDAGAFQASDDEEEKTADKKEAEKAAAKPTLHLSSLPPGTSPAVIKSLIPSVLAVDNVKILPPPPPSAQGGERRVWSAIVTLAKDTAATDMDTVVSSLQNKYLGWGFYLSISRHLSSAAINTAIPITHGLASLTNQPFGARPVAHGHLSRGPPPGPHRSGFAPPSSYGPSYHNKGNQGLQVEVKLPSDLKELKLIHKTLENLLTYGPEFEALLMSRPEVQREEKWAWVWNPRSTGGVFYRWKLWDILTNPGKTPRRNRTRAHPVAVFENGPNWVEPENNLRFEFTTKLNEFVSDEEYDSSDDDDSDREEERRLNEGVGDVNDGMGHLNPLQKAKLTHLLARLPTVHSRLRRGDVARITAFAIKHAGTGGEEVVDMIVSNVNNPFAYTVANPDRQQNENEAREAKARSDGLDDSVNTDIPGQPAQNKKSSSNEKLDTSSAQLVGLYIISDILSSSSTSGVRHAWRYRQLFENALKLHKTFERLGRLEKELGWGRLKMEKWRRSVGILLSLWEGWCVFPQASQEHFTRSFEQPPPTEKELAEAKNRADAEKAAGVFGGKGKSKWKAVDDTADTAARFNPIGASGDVDGMDIDIDGAPIPDEDEDLDGVLMSDIDGVPMEDSDMEDLDGAPLEENDGESQQQQQQQQQQEHVGFEISSKKDEPSSERRTEQPPPARRRRPKAEDMFADSDTE